MVWKSIGIADFDKRATYVTKEQKMTKKLQNFGSNWSLVVNCLVETCLY